MKSSSIAERAKPFRLVKYFTFTSLIVLFIGTIILSLLNTHWVRSMQYQKSEDYALLLIENLNHQVFMQFILPVGLKYGKIELRNQEQFERMDNVVRSTLHSFKVEMVNIFSKNDIIAYSFSPELVGMENLGGTFYKNALEGQSSSKLVQNGTFWEILLGIPKEIKIITFAPLRAEKPLSPISGPVLGVVEIRQDLSSDYRKIFKFQVLVICSISIVMGILLLTLIYVVKRGEGIIEKRAFERIRLKVDNQLIEGFLDFISWVNQELDAESDVHVVEDLGDRLQRELTPYVLLARTAERCYSKPRGYAGDYKTIEMIYQNKPGGTGRLGPLLDHCFLEMHAAYAVRNRRGVLAREIDATIDRSSDGPVNVTSMACGPAEEIFDVFKKSPDSENLKASLIDIDPEAIDFVTQRSVEAGLESQIDVHLANLVYLATGRATLGLAPQDLVYSIGLIDYFNDQFVINLMNYGYELLKPGGRMILGNFHPSNPTKAFMDWVTDWKLIHRTEEDMNRLYSASRFASPCSRILYEEQRINLFAECEKAEN